MASPRCIVGHCEGCWREEGHCIEAGSFQRESHNIQLVQNIYDTFTSHDRANVVQAIVKDFVQKLLNNWTVDVVSAWDLICLKSFSTIAAKPLQLPLAHFGLIMLQTSKHWSIRGLSSTQLSLQPQLMNNQLFTIMTIALLLKGLGKQNHHLTCWQVNLRYVRLCQFYAGGLMKHAFVCCFIFSF